MNALSVALRSLDPHAFERLVTALLKARYPGEDIKRLDGRAGDGGLDVIAGWLDERPTVWQCKCFDARLGDSQKQQIRTSLKRALETCNPHRWVLCVNTDFDSMTMGWWQRLARSYSGVEFGLWQGSDLLQQLLYFDSIRDSFFPGIAINVPIIREAVAGTKTLSDEDLAALAEQSIDAVLARLEHGDARFTYAVTRSRNQVQSTKTPSDSMLTVTRGKTTICVSPRDREALTMRPPTVNLEVKAGGVDKMYEHHRTGVPVKLSSDEIAGFCSDFDFLLPKQRDGMTVQIDPAAPCLRIPMRVVFGEGAESVTYEYIEFTRVYSGTEQATFQSTTPLPFPIKFVVSLDGTGNVSFQNKCTGYPVAEALKMARAVIVAVSCGKAAFFDLSRGKPFFQVKLVGEVPLWIRSLRRFLQDTSSIAAAYDVELAVPGEITKDDCATMDFLRSLDNGFSATLEPVILTLEKVADARSELPEASYRIDLPEFPREIVLFDQRVLTGPVRYEISRARVREPEAYSEFLNHATPGSVTTVTLEPIGNVTIRRLRPS